MDKITVGPSYDLSAELLRLLLDHCVLQLGGQVTLRAGDLVQVSQQYHMRVTSNLTQHLVTLTLLSR